MGDPRPLALVPEILHETEVEHLDDVGGAATRTEEDVARLDVAVGDADAVRRVQGAADLAHDLPLALVDLARFCVARLN